MTNEDNLEFGKFYNKMLAEFKNHKIKFTEFKKKMNCELKKRTYQENAEVLIFAAVSLLLNKDSNLIYNVLQKNIISTQVENGDYYPF